MKYFIGLFFIFCVLLLSSCHQKKQPVNLYTDTLTFENTDTLSNLSAEKKPTDNTSIYYGLYSPAEVSDIFNRSHIGFNPELLNPPNNASEYNTTTKIAINLGVYGADLSYIRLFNSGDAEKYLNTILKLSDQLGIPGTFIQDLSQRLERNRSNADSLTQITVEAFNGVNKFLLEQDQESTAYLIITGAWIEAMYIAAHDLLNIKDPEIIKKVLEQKYSLAYLLSSLKNHYNDPGIAYYYRMLFVLNKYMKKTEISFKNLAVQIDHKNKKIRASGDIFDFSPEVIKKIKNIIFTIRDIVVNE